MKYILIIESNKENRDVLIDSLEDKYKVDSCESKEEAYKILERKIPNLIIIEQEEEISSVMELLEKIRKTEELHNIPIVVVSDGSDEEFERSCMEAGVGDFIFRPFSKVGILSRVNRVFEIESLKKQIKNEITLKDAEVNEIRNQAKKDPLTKLWNRVYTEENVNAYLEERRHRGTLLMIDLDNFKEINDTFGHIAGDELLIEFAQTIEALCRQDDIVCRLGGDEFVVFLKDVCYQAVVSEKIEQLIMTLEKRIQKPDGKGSISVSVGVAIAPMDGRNFNQLYQNADKSLYYVKQNGKGTYHFFSEEGVASVGTTKKKSTQVDLEHLKNFIQEMGYKKGAYQVEYEGFKKIYRFVARCICRTGQNVQTLLFTLSSENGDVPETQQLAFAMDNLKNAVNESIRRADVATNYSSSQFVVILMDSTVEDGHMVAKRIVDKYSQRLNYHSRVVLDYDIQTVVAAPSSNDF